MAKLRTVMQTGKLDPVKVHLQMRTRRECECPQPNRRENWIACARLRRSAAAPAQLAIKYERAGERERGLLASPLFFLLLVVVVVVVIAFSSSRDCIFYPVQR